MSTKQVSTYGTLSARATQQAQHAQRHVFAERNPRLIERKCSRLSATEWNDIGAYKKSVDNATKFIPPWVKVAVAFALGLGTMIGWKRIVVTVGEKIGKAHLTYAQGASAELVAMATIGLADASGCRSAPPTCFLRRRRHDGGQQVRPADGRRSAT